MAWIALEGMRFHAFHGVYEAEKTLGTEYVLDVFVQTDISLAAATDEVAATVNYETVYRICQMEMAESRNLIETVVENIVEGLKKQFASIQAVRVKLRKLNPPLGGKVDASSVETEEEFVTGCPRCGKPFICYADENCWCKSVNLHPATAETIRRQFKTCLCPACLKFYAG